MLDLNNLYVNAINHKYDPYEFINKLPLDRVVEVHLAGCDYIHGMLVDTHASKVKDAVINLLKYLSTKIKINGVVIERDDRLNNFSDSYYNSIKKQISQEGFAIANIIGHTQSLNKIAAWLEGLLGNVYEEANPKRLPFSKVQAEKLFIMNCDWFTTTG